MGRLTSKPAASSQPVISSIDQVPGRLVSAKGSSCGREAGPGSPAPAERTAADRLDSWKEIAPYLRRDVVASSGLYDQTLRRIVEPVT